MSQISISTQQQDDQNIVVIDAQGGGRWHFVDIREIWQYRRLVQLLITRDVSARYKQTIVGMLWIIITPLVMMFVFNFVFANLAGVGSYDIPYPIFSFSGLVVWGLFSRGITQGSTAIVKESGLLRKVYFPRVILPMAKILAGMIDFAMSFVVLIVMMIVMSLITDYTIYLGPRLLLLPFFTLLALITALGLSLWFSSIHVRYRDVSQLVPFMVQVLFILSPVGYPSSLVSGPMQYLYALNPMVAILDGYRWSLLGIDSLNFEYAAISTAAAMLLLVSGVFVFNRLEQTFTDYL